MPSVQAIALVTPGRTHSQVSLAVLLGLAIGLVELAILTVAVAWIEQSRVTLRHMRGRLSLVRKALIAFGGVQVALLTSSILLIRLGPG